MLELTALPSIDKDIWVPTVQVADVLLVNGGDTMYLCHWMRQSGLADLLPSLRGVYVGLSAASILMAPHIGKRFAYWTPPGGGDETLGLGDFAIFPHLNNEGCLDSRWPTRKDGPLGCGCRAMRLTTRLLLRWLMAPLK